MTNLMYFSLGWILGGITIWIYFHAMRLIRTKEEWENAYQTTQGEV